MKENLTIKEAHEGLSLKKFSVNDLCKIYTDRIKEKNEEISAFLEVFDDINKQAKEAQKLIDEKRSSKLTGIPLAIKDNILIKDRNVFAGSKALEGYIAPYDSTVTTKLKKEAAIFLGRTNMDEFAMGASTEKSAFTITKNPNDTSRVPGGSSGGSAAAVSSKMAPAALGSDTGGSIRQPSSFCGCVGFKPTYGAVSRSGLIAMGSSLDQIGPITQTVTDSEIIFNSISGKDPFDSTTYEKEDHKETRKNKVIGVPWHLIEQKGVDEDILQIFKKNIKDLKEVGYKIKEIELPHLKYTLSAYYVLVQAEVSSNMARIDGMRYGSKVEGKDLQEDYNKTRALFGKEVKRRIMAGTYVLSAGYYDTYYNRAYTVKKLAISDFEKAFSDEKDPVDAIAFPTTPTTAFKIGEKNEDPLQMYMADVFTVPANIAGIPAISIPSGEIKKEGKSLPSSLQLMAPWKKEKDLFTIGKRFKKEEN